MAALCVLLAASSAWAKKRVVVLDFTGPQSGKAEAAVVAAVKKKFTVVSSAQYTKAQKKLKAKKQTDKNVAKIAAEIQVDAVVSGTVKKKGGKWTLTLIVREGASGRVKGSPKIALRAPRIDQRAKDDIEAEVLPIVEGLDSISGGGGVNEFGATDEPVATTEKPPKKGKKPPVEEEQPATTPPSDETGEEEAAPGVDDASKVASNEGGETGTDSSISKSTGDEGSATELVGSKYARDGAFQVEVGVSAIARSLTFNTRAGLDPKKEPNGYNGAIVPGALVSGEVYPLAFMSPGGALAGVGLTFVFDRVFLLKSKYGPDEYDSTQQRWGVGLSYRLNIGNRPTLPTIHVGIGYNSLSFTIDSGAKVILPNVDYVYLDPNLGVRLPLGTPKLAFLADARYMVISGSGQFSENAYYGGGTVKGIDLDGGFEYRLMDRMPIHLGVRYIRIAYDFDGTGAGTKNLDGTNMNDVGGALDEYLGGYVTAGYIF